MILSSCALSLEPDGIVDLGIEVDAYNQGVLI
jgi:hypothetical protein